MQWVARRYLPEALVVLSLVVVLVTGVSTGAIAPEAETPPAISCFEPATATLRVTLKSQCPSPLISLGGAPLTESLTAENKVDGLHPLLSARFEAARRVAALEGVTLYITSGFRTADRQATLFANAIKKYGSETEAAKWVLPARFSHHPHGLAIDVNYPGDRAGAQWLEIHGSHFGLCRVYANEWWHFEGVIAPGESCPAMAANALVDLG